MHHSRFLIIFTACLVVITACSKKEPAPTSAVTTNPSQDSAIFSIVAIPDTQNYLDYTHQKADGFALDAADQYLQQMRYIATLAPSRGGDLAFVTHLGDVWQHQTVAMDAEHAELGFKAVPNRWFAAEIKTAPDEVRAFEIPRAVEGFQFLADADIPFAVVPGNHDYDAMWSAAGWTPVEKVQDIRMTAETLGMLHAGGLENFRSVFGANSQFFSNKPWYVSSFDGGTSSAQTFSAGGYTFMHLALTMSPKDDVLAWASSVIQKNYGLPTIVTTHDYLNSAGERKANPIVDFHRADPRHNNAQMLWDKFIKENDQIFMVLSGHQWGQSLAPDINSDGHFVYQILADYQDRGQSGVDAGQALHPLLRRPVGIGDGWLRRMTFDFSQAMPTMAVKTYSSHYQINSQELKDYAKWYGAHEQPDMNEAQFIAADNFEVKLEDFRQRFGEGVISGN
jgi:hypothetical protein